MLIQLSQRHIISFSTNIHSGRIWNKISCPRQKGSIISRFRSRSQSLQRHFIPHAFTNNFNLFSFFWAVWGLGKKKGKRAEAGEKEKESAGRKSSPARPWCFIFPVFPPFHHRWSLCGGERSACLRPTPFWLNSSCTHPKRLGGCVERSPNRGGDG